MFQYLITVKNIDLITLLKTIIEHYLIQLIFRFMYVTVTLTKR